MKQIDNQDFNDVIICLEVSFLVRLSKGNCGAEWKIKLLETNPLPDSTSGDLMRPGEKVERMASSLLL